MINKEIIFSAMSGLTAVSGKELHFNVDDGNQVSWRVIPRGEQGRSLPFNDSQELERFVQDYARRLGFTIRLEGTNSAKAELPT